MIPKKSPNPSSTFYLLDILRGLSAFAVVIWHYQHFFFEGTSLDDGFDRRIQPFYRFFWLFYQEGSRAVQLFFVLSGFIFFYHYLYQIKRNEISASRFFILRFSRLYPLYIVTLILVAVGQWISYTIDGAYIVYPCNTVPRFFLSLLFISEWLPEKYLCSVAFNGPAWSLSVEAFLYVIFFIFAKYIASNKSIITFLMTVLIVLASFIAYKYHLYHLVGEPVLCFFSGGVAFFFWMQFTGNRLTAVFMAMSFVVCSLTFILRTGINTLVLELVFYPAIVLLLALLQTGEQGRQLKLTGEVTYSVYLLHFPIQLSIILMLKILHIHLDFRSTVFWLFYFCFLIAVSILSFKHFERPTQRFLRSIYERKSKSFFEQRLKPTPLH